MNSFMFSCYAQFIIMCCFVIMPCHAVDSGVSNIIHVTPKISIASPHYRIRCSFRIGIQFTVNYMTSETIGSPCSFLNKLMCYSAVSKKER